MDADLRDLLAAWLSDADPGEARREALLARLRGDPDFRQAFVEEIRLLGMLRVVQSAEPRWLRLEDVCGWSRSQAGSVAALADHVVQTALQRESRRRLWRWIWPAAAILLVLAGAALLGTRSQPESRPASHLELATAVQLDAVRWGDNGDLTPDEGGTVTAGRLQLKSGRVTLAYFNGVILTVEGPADLDLHSLDRLTCRQGQLRGRVPPGAEGFTLLTTQFEVIQLGDEFGLNVPAGAPADLALFEGSAALSLLDGHGRSVRSLLLGAPRQVEIEAQSGRVRDVPTEHQRFVAFPGVLPQDLELRPSYRDHVLAARPRDYWRFERLTNEQIPNEIPGGPGLLVLGGVRLDGTAGGNHWAYFRPDSPQQALLLDGEWTPPRGSGYAVEMWVQSDALGQNALFSLIDRAEGPEQHVALVELTARSQRTPFEPCAVRFLDRWPPGEMGGVNVFSRRAFVPALWHHLVAQKTGTALELYLDGRLAGSSPPGADSADPEHVTTPCRLLVGRLKQWPVRVNNQIRPFEGRIDELAIYERPLTVEEIRHHARQRLGKNHE